MGGLVVTDGEVDLPGRGRVGLLQGLRAQRGLPPGHLLRRNRRGGRHGQATPLDVQSPTLFTFTPPCAPLPLPSQQSLILFVSYPHHQELPQPTTTFE